MSGGGTPKNPELVTPQMLRGWPLPDPRGAKSSRGQVLVVGGSRKTPGAVRLAAEAALRVGAGRLGMGAPESVAVPMAVSLPESGVVGLPEDPEGALTGTRTAELLTAEAERADCLLLGPGMASPEGTITLMEALVPMLRAKTKVTLDAYGFTVLPDVSTEVRDSLKGRIVAHINAAEMAFLLDTEETDDQDEVVAGLLKLARRFGAVITCREWIVSDDGGVWRTTTGDTGLGTSGSGDVLAGTIAGLVARDADRAQAAVWATHLHAAAGEHLAGHVGRIGYLASELLPVLPVAMSRLQGD